ncbi:ComF family protein [Sphaerimonospora thailandensis]|uniref:ComF family protein n=1 Tax=Sphaerimonospora thailandensis TaxID=795644 RepID=UPI00195263E1|nr:phosphoribosyltransferase family protein [Sphaerimonospora thailandensis]
MLAALLDLVIPPRCAGCDEPGSVACRACTAQLLRDPAPRPPDPPPPGLPECWSATAYDGAARRMILAFKEHGRTAVAPILGACLAQVTAAALTASAEWADRGPRPVVLVPVPSARAASWKRGHDPVRAVSRAAAAELRTLGLPVMSAPMLRQVRRVADQAGLSSTRRAANLSGAFDVVPGRTGLLATLGSRGVVVVLVDDIVTTGSTLAEAARAIRLAGVRVPLAVTVAATRRKDRQGRGRHAQGAGRRTMTESKDG